MDKKAVDWWQGIAQERVQRGAGGRRSKRQAGNARIFQRKEYRTLSKEERDRFHQALVRSKTTRRGNTTEYDMFVRVHQPSESPGAHFGAAFLPWHREFLFRLELTLQQYHPSVTIPYWDSSLDAGLPNPRDSIIFDEAFMGTASGTWRARWAPTWPVLEECRLLGSRVLQRQDSLQESQALWQNDDIDYILRQTAFQEVVIPPYFEWEHGGGHIYVGGHMDNITCSPSDPLFFLHHSFVDYLWQTFRERSQTTERTMEYPTHINVTRNIGGALHNPNTPMRPFGPLWNIHGLQTVYQDYYYSYAPRPRTCTRDSDCGRYLFCNRGNCMSKVRLGGDCTGLPEGRSPCYCGECRRGRCTSPGVTVCPDV